VGCCDVGGGGAWVTLGGLGGSFGALPGKGTNMRGAWRAFARRLAGREDEKERDAAECYVQNVEIPSSGLASSNRAPRAPGCEVGRPIPFDVSNFLACMLVLPMVL
jgi:hypothetical protein